MIYYLHTPCRKYCFYNLKSSYILNRLYIFCILGLYSFNDLYLYVSVLIQLLLIDAPH